MENAQVVITMSPDGLMNVRSNIPNPLVKLGLIQLALVQQTEAVLHPEQTPKILPFRGPIPEPPKQD